MWVHTLFRKWRSCEMMIMVLARALITSSSQRMVLMSRLLVGSSSSRMSGIGKQRLRQQHAQLEAGRDFLHRSGVQFDRDAHAEQQLAGARFGGVAVQLAELDFQLGGAHVVVFAGFRIGVDRVLLLLHFPQFGVAHHHHVEHHVVSRRRTDPGAVCRGARQDRSRRCPQRVPGRRREFS